jgi:Transcriptional regulator
MILMTLQQLQYFRTLAKIQHYTKAAEQLLISQPSLSYSIAELEKELNISLFVKQGKKIKLSFYGELFLNYVERSLDLLDEGKRTVEIFADPLKGRINLGYLYSVSSSLVPKIIESFYKDKSNKSITFNFIQNLNNVLIDDLKSGKIDLAFCVKPPKDISFIPILEQELYVIVPKSHPYAGRKEINLMEVQSEPFVFLNKNSGLREMVDDVFRDLAFKPKIVFEAEECNAVITYVSLNFGISIIPAVPALDTSNVSTLKITYPKCTRTVYMAWMENNYTTPPVKKVKDFIISSFGIA